MRGSSLSGKYRSNFPHGLMFHRFHSSHKPATKWQGALTQQDFEEILLYVGTENILSPEEWIERLENGRLCEQDLCITFDDGLRCQVEYALPVLENYGLRTFWFVYSCVLEGMPVKSEFYSYVAGQIGGMESLIEEFLRFCPSQILGQLESEEFLAYAQRMREPFPFYSPNDIKYRFLRRCPSNLESFEAVMDQIVRNFGFELEEVAGQLWLSEVELKTLCEKGHYIGLHSYDHPYEMSQLTFDDQRKQYETNYAHILRVCNKPIQCMSHPLNSYNEDSLAILQELDIRCGFRSNVVPPLSQGINPSPLELAREDSVNLLFRMRGIRP